MKKVFLLMTFLCLALTTQADPYWKVVEGLVYSIDGDSKTATVCAASDYTKDATYDAGTSGELVYKDDVVIPATIPNPDDAEQPFKVIAINGDAFSNNTEITSITINSEEITAIPDNCFKGCTGLTSISFGEKVTTITTIGNNAFEGCTQLGSITIPTSVTTIGSNAFEGCTGMTSVNINAKITEIPDNCFKGCTGLTSISFGEDVTTIGNNAFEGCTQLGSITIPLSVTTIGSNAFDSCTKITTLIISGSGAMNDYDDPSSRPWHSFIGQLTSVVIESGVTKIGNNAFSGSTKLESINIPATITTISSTAFSGCSSLLKVTFASIQQLCGIEFEGKSANPLSIAHHLYFSDNEKPDEEVKEINLTSVTEIKQYAFSECWGLTEIYIPASVTTIGTDAFDFEEGKKANKPFPKTSFASIESLCRTDFATMKSNPIYYQNDVYIGTSAAQATAQTTIDIPITSLKEGHLGANILANASKIVSVSIPMGTTSIGENAFYNCTSLMVANYPSLDAVKTIDYGNDYSKPLRYATYLKVNNVDQSVLTIDYNVDEGAFANQKWLEKVIFTGNVTKIGKEAFKNCPNLTTAEFNTTTQMTIEEGAFKSCMKLTSVNLPDGLVELGKEAFRDCRKLTTVTIPQTCKTLGTGVFRYCWGLTTAVIESEVVTIPKLFFYDCNKLNNVTLPNTVTTIDSEAFKTCKALTVFPALEKLTTIKNDAFNGCSGLTNLVLPDKVQIIDKSAFAGCSGITSLTIPESTTDIRSKAFYGCNSLTQVFSLISDPTNMTVEADIFGDRASSITLYVPSTEAKSLYKDERPWNQISFKDIIARIEATLSFYVNDKMKVSITKMAGLALESADLDMINNCVQLGENDQFSGWNETIPDVMPNENKKFYGYISYIREIDGFKWHLYPEENPGAEENPKKSCMAVLISITDEKANSQKDIEIPSKVTCEEVTYPVEVISSNAFKDRKKIEVVTLPDNDNLKIESEVFKGCSEITQVKNFPKSITVISDGLFSGCKSLDQIEVKGKENSNSLPETITEIGREAFKGCSNFNLKAFPTNLTTIGSQAFYGSGMTSISLKNLTLDKEIFRECKKLKTVIFENDFSLAVPNHTFYGCTQLEKVTLGNVNRINQGAFKGCTSLANITIPKTVGFIGNEAFAGCIKLQQITEESTEPPYANVSAFDANTYANAILYVPENSNDVYGTADTWNNFTNRIVSAEFNLIYLLDGVKSYKEVDGVQKRTRTAKAGATIKIDDENDALNEDEKKGREFSGWYFSDCQDKSMVMPNHDVTVKGGLQYFVTYYDEKNNKKADGGSFYDANIVIPVEDLNNPGHKFTITFKNIKKKDNSEDGYEDLIVTQDEVATIEIKMPANDIQAIVTYAQSEAEKVYENLKYRIVNMNTATPHAVLIDGSLAEGDVDIPPTIDYEGVDKPIPVTVIGNRVFKDNRKLTRITIPESIVEMGTENFAYCFKLASFSISEKSKINTLPKLTFIGCGKLESATLPDGIKTIGDQAFSKCSLLSSVSLPSTLDSIGERAFSECKLLKKITLPPNLNYIGEFAFYHALGENGELTIVKKKDNNATEQSKLPSASEITFDDTTYEFTTLKTNLPADNDPWTKFANIVTVSDEGGSGQVGQCKEPSISYNYKDKKLVFNCDEQGATIVYKISVEDQKKGEVTSESEGNKPEGETFLVRKYVVTAYAKKTGLNPSNPKRLELPWYSKGDVNDDGFVTVTDAVEVIRICTGDTDNTGEPTSSE